MSVTDGDDHCVIGRSVQVVKRLRTFMYVVFLRFTAHFELDVETRTFTQMGSVPIGSDGVMCTLQNQV